MALKVSTKLKNIDRYFIKNEFPFLMGEMSWHKFSKMYRHIIIERYKNKIPFESISVSKFFDSSIPETRREEIYNFLIKNVKNFSLYDKEYDFDNGQSIALFLTLSVVTAHLRDKMGLITYEHFSGRQLFHMFEFASKYCDFPNP